MSAAFQNSPLIAGPSISTLGLSVSSYCQYHDHLESKAKLASKNWGSSTERNDIYRQNTDWPCIAQVRAHMEYCSHISTGAPYPWPIWSTHCRAVRIVLDPMICERLDTLALRRDVFTLCVLYCIVRSWGAAAKFSNRTVGTSFHAPLNCGMEYLQQCYQVDTTWIPSKSASISTLNAGNVLWCYMGSWAAMTTEPWTFNLWK